MSLFDDLKAEVDKGRAGGNSGIPMGFDRLNHYIGIRRRLYFLVGGNTGSGKTSFIDDCFVLNPFDWYISREGQNSGKTLKIWYRSMERSRAYKVAKWVSRKIFKDHGLFISVNKLLSWNEKLSDAEYKIFMEYQGYMEQLSDIVTVIDGPENAVGIAKDLQKFALKRGKVIQLDEYNKQYIPDDPNEIVIVVID